MLWSIKKRNPVTEVRGLQLCQRGNLTSERYRRGGRGLFDGAGCSQIEPAHQMLTQQPAFGIVEPDRTTEVIREVGFIGVVLIDTGTSATATTTEFRNLIRINVFAHTFLLSKFFCFSYVKHPLFQTFLL